MGKSNQFRILRDDDKSEWQFVSQKFDDALIEFRDTKNSQLPKVDGHRAREWSLSRIYKEIEKKTLLFLPNSAISYTELFLR